MTARATLWAAVLLASLGLGLPARAEEPLSPKAEAALHLTQSEDAYQQQLGFLRLEALREAATIPYLEQSLNHRLPDIRAYAVRALAAVQGAAAVPRLIDRAQHDGHARVRRAAIMGLEPLAAQDATVLPVLIRALTDRASEVRMAAVDIVSRIDDPQAREALQLRQRRESRRDVRRVLKLALQRNGS